VESHCATCCASGPILEHAAKFPTCPDVQGSSWLAKSGMVKKSGELIIWLDTPKLNYWT
jgi:hypothetical protein